MRCVETHLSRVWIGERHVYKLLKPVRFPFVDLSTADARERELRAELAHNQPWAPGVYEAVVRVTGEPPREDPEGKAFALRMRRLPDDRTLEALGEQLDASDITRVGRTLRERHDRAPVREGSAAPFAVVARIRENLAELEDLEPPGFDGVPALFEDTLTAVADVLQAHARDGRLLHADLRAEHVYLLDEGVAVLDGVAFAPELAEGDPLEDVAFLAMDLCATVARWDLEQPLWTAWSAGDPPDPALCALYVGHRAAIRAKVALLQQDVAAYRRMLQQIRFRLLPAAQRPCLLGIGGLPGVGKSTVARELADAHGLTVIRTDVVRDEVDPEARYTDAGRTAVYRAVLDHARERFYVGEQRVLIDASFGKADWRALLTDLAHELGVPSGLLVCEAPEAVALERIAARQGDPSEADAEAYRIVRDAWEPVHGRHGTVHTDQPVEHELIEATGILRAWQLA